MKLIKRLYDHIFIDGLSGMASGLFATLIMGTIIQQIGLLLNGPAGEFLVVFAKIASAMTGAGIGIGVAARMKSSTLVTVSAAVAGMVGAFASKLLAGTVITDAGVVLSGPGEPLGAFIAALAAIEIGRLVADRTKIDIILTPFVCIITGSAVGLFVGPPISNFMTWLGSLINWGTEQQPFLMGIIVSVLMGMILTLPISSAALGIILNLSGLAAGAATVGCCCNMIGFAIASFKENGFSGLIAQGLGTSMLQVPNIMRKPIIWLPAIIASAILGPISTVVLKMTNTATGSGMGTAGLVGPITAYQTMSATMDPVVVFAEILLMYFILPAIIAGVVSAYMRNHKLINDGDMKLEV